MIYSYKLASFTQKHPGATVFKTFAQEVDQYHRTLCLRLENTWASWERAGAGMGWRELKVEAHRKANWVSFTMTEKGEKSYRETMLTLSREQALALRTFLNDCEGLK